MSAALSVEIYRTFKETPDFELKRPITHTELSIFSNIAEGYEYNFKKARKFAELCDGISRRIEITDLNRHKQLPYQKNRWLAMNNGIRRNIQNTPQAD